MIAQKKQENMNKPQLFHRIKTYVRVFFYEIYKCTTCLGWAEPSIVMEFFCMQMKIYLIFYFITGSAMFSGFMAIKYDEPS